MTEYPIKNCLNCDSTKLSFKEINIEIKGGLLEIIIDTDKFKKLDEFTCRGCGFVMFFDHKITTV